MNGTTPIHWTATAASAEVFALGEGPVRLPDGDGVLWVDIDAGAIHEGRLDGDRVEQARTWHVDGTAGAAVRSVAGDLLVAGRRGLVTIAAAGERRAGPVIIGDGVASRLNDGACDPAGRFLVGSMAVDGARGRDVLVRVEADERVTVLDDDLTLSNGLAWSPGGDLLYSVDSVPGTVWVRSYDAATGAAGPRRSWLRFDDDVPDGMCVDAEGHAWIAFWGAGEVRRFTPDGRHAGTVVVAAPHVTSVAFVGGRLDRLLITTATSELSPDQLAAWPDSGRLFLADVGVTGRAPTPWAGPR
jgi:sugar lactone lactonase YvrE